MVNILSQKGTLMISNKDSCTNRDGRPNYPARRATAAAVAALAILGTWKTVELANNGLEWLNTDEKIGCTTTTAKPHDTATSMVMRSIEEIDGADPAWDRETQQAANNIGPVNPGDKIEVCVLEDKIPFFGQYVVAEKVE